MSQKTRDRRKVRKERQQQKYGYQDDRQKKAPWPIQPRRFFKSKPVPQPAS